MITNEKIFKNTKVPTNKTVMHLIHNFLRDLSLLNSAGNMFQMRDPKIFTIFYLSVTEF